MRNRIYQSIFTRNSGKEVTPSNWPRTIFTTSIVILFLGFAIWYTQFLPRPYIERLCTAVDDVPIVEYNKLKNIPGFSGTADELLAEYWDRWALRAEVLEERNESLLYRLKALTLKDTVTRRGEAGRLIGTDYTDLMVTYCHNNSVSAVAFSPDGKTIIVATNWWIHQYVVNGNGIIPKSSRLLPGSRCTGAYHFLDEQGDKMQLAVDVTGDSIRIITLRFDIPDTPPIQGDPKELLEQWQKKLALELDEYGTFRATNRIGGAFGW